MANIYITITPISGKPNTEDGKRARRDFKEQQERNSHLIDGDMFWCWDDSKSNKSIPGDLFAFFHSKKKLTIHRIEKVKKPIDRLSSWSDNVGQGDRNVLELSAPLETFSMEEWRAMNGHFSNGWTMGTQRVCCSKEEKPFLYKIISRL